jgi:DNA repair photolyase
MNINKKSNDNGVAVRERRCKNVLNRTSICDWSLNCYTGCAHGCAYCYARYMQRFHPHPEPWGRFVDVKINAVEALQRQLAHARPGVVFMSSACDGWQPIERRCGLTRQCCRLLVERGFEIHALTKSTLILRDLDVLAAGRSRVGITIVTLDERLCRLWEPGASPVNERLRVPAEARRAGLATSIMFGPLLPFLSDDADSLVAMFSRAAELNVDQIYVDALNPRPKVWASVDALLRRRFPALREPYRRILFEKDAREEYLDHLQERVERAAKQSGAIDRLTVCF